MKNELTEFNKIAIAVHPKNHQAYALAEEIADSLKKDEKKVILGRRDDKKLRAGICDGCQDLLIALGGDTM